MCTNGWTREVVKGVSGVFWDTPIFLDLFYEFERKGDAYGPFKSLHNEIGGNPFFTFIAFIFKGQKYYFGHSGSFLLYSQNDSWPSTTGNGCFRLNWAPASQILDGGFAYLVRSHLKEGCSIFCFYVKSTQNVPKLDEIEINFSAIHRPKIILTKKQKRTGMTKIVLPAFKNNDYNGKKWIPS